MSESLEGFSVAATRQNSGSLLYSAAAAAGAGAPGGINSPAATFCAEVIVVFACPSDFRLSHEVAIAGEPANATIASRKAKIPARIPIFRVSSLNKAHLTHRRHLCSSKLPTPKPTARVLGVLN